MRRDTGFTTGRDLASLLIYEKDRYMTASSVEGGTRATAGYRTGAFLLILVATVLVYLPGLSGPFVFDDFGSLSRLGDLGGIRD